MHQGKGLTIITLKQILQKLPVPLPQNKEVIYLKIYLMNLPNNTFFDQSKEIT